MKLVAIGASAGGPAALATILRALPPDFPAAIVIVQHIDAHMAQGMADWLATQGVLAVRVANEGDRPTAGTALVASTSDHLVFKSAERVGYTREPVDYAYRPSVDAFFNSIQSHWRGDVIGVLLSGMGRDGAKGLKALRQQGRYTIAQDEQTSAVYGMPKAAAKLDAAVEILPVERIGPALISLVGAERNQRL